MRNADFTKAIGNDGVGVDSSSLVVNFNSLRRIRIIIHDHFSISDDCYTTNLAGVQPTQMDVGVHAISVIQIEMCHVMNIGLYMGVGLDFNLSGCCSKQVE